MPIESNSPKNTVWTGYAWNAGLLVFRQVLTFGVTVVVARLLHPRDFGLFALAAVTVGIIGVVQDLGVARVVVYYRDNDADYPFYSTVSIAMSALLAVLAILAAPLVSAFYSEPRLTLLLQVASLSILLSGARLVSVAVLNKDMNFRAVSIMEGGGAALGAACVLALVLAGCGVWSLLANLLAPGAVATAAALWLVPLRLRLRGEHRALRRLWSYGLPLGASSVLWQLYDNADFLVVGKLLGAAPLGAYTLAFHLATIVNQKLVSIVSSVTFPALAAIQGERDRVVDHWFALMRHLSLMSFPLLMMLAVGADDVVAVVYGAKWAAAVLPLRFLCAVGCLRTLTPFCTMVASAQGRADINLKYSLLNCLLLPPGFYVGCRMAGLLGVALAWAFLFPVVCVGMFWLVCRQLRVPFRDFAANLRVPVATALLAGVAMLLMRPLFNPGLLRLLVVGTTGAAVSLGFLLVEGRLIKELWRMVSARF
jgi:O-antigen/teichoic acid export membrane protein